MGACASVGHGNRKPGTAAEERVGRREPDPQSPSLSEASVLIEGETGTGKELIARAVHYLSKRAPFPFIALNCGSLPDTLIEAELFGHERGAFTDAQSARQGLIAQAEGGTLFLDEIDTLPPKAQVGILRLVQDKCYRVLGSTKEHQADIRILAAPTLPSSSWQNPAFSGSIFTTAFASFLFISRERA